MATGGKWQPREATPAEKSAGATQIAALVIDPEPGTRRTFAAVVEELGFRALTASNGAEALEQFHRSSPALVLLDLGLSDFPARHILRHLRAHDPDVHLVVLASKPDVRTAVEVVRDGATEFLDKSIRSEDLRSVLHRLSPHPPRRSTDSPVSTGPDRDRVAFFSQYQHLFRHSERMRDVQRIVVQVADTNATVLIQGETGVGKELVARACHYLSDRARQPWLKVNCASLPAELLESELFGHEKGAFTGAASLKPGRFELANGGTLLLDEIGELPLGLQAKILHVLQDNEFFRVGGRELISVDVRVIAATSKNLAAMVATGHFREDLYYRLNVVNIVVAPLRQRREEIPFLVDYFCGRFSTQFNRPKPSPSDKALSLLLAYPWPGNVRELENLVKRWVVLREEAHICDELEFRLRALGGPGPGIGVPANPGRTGLDLKDIGRRAAREAELAILKETLDRVRWNRAEAARILKISYKTLLHKLSEANIDGRSRPKSTG